MLENFSGNCCHVVMLFHVPEASLYLIELIISAGETALMGDTVCRRGIVFDIGRSLNRLGCGKPYSNSSLP